MGKSRSDPDTDRLAELLPWLEWLDQLLQRAYVAAQALYGEGAANDSYRGLYIRRQDFEKLLARGPLTPALPRTDGLYQAGGRGRLGVLQERLALSPLELSTLVIALAPDIDPRYERLFAYLQDDVTRRRPTVDLLLNLLCQSAEEKIAQRGLFSRNGVLLRYRLIHLLSDPHQLRPSLLSQQISLRTQFV